MAGRIFGVLIAGIAASALLAAGLANMQRSAEVSAERADRVVDRVAAAIATDPPPPGTRRLDAMPPGIAIPDLAQRIATRLPRWPATQVLGVDRSNCRPRPPLPPAAPSSDLPRQEAVPLPPPPPPPPPEPTDAPSACYAVRLAGPSAAPIILAVDSPPDAKLSQPVASLSFLTALGLGAVVLALIVARMAARPIARLGAAAHDLADDLDADPIAEDGPGDVRRASAAFNDMQAQLRRTVEERTYMLAAISHDLRTPLTRMRLRLDAITDHALRDRLAGDAQAMARLIEEGLELARMTRGGRGEDRPVDIAALVSSLCEDAREAGQDVSCVAPVAVVLRTSVDALRRIIGNLIDNAVHHAGSAEVRIEQSTASVEIQILDRGPGIPVEELERVFDPFRQLDGTRPVERGSGLGLTIARLLARHVGGSVTLANRPGGGAIAAIRLPLD